MKIAFVVDKDNKILTGYPYHGTIITIGNRMVFKNGQYLLLPPNEEIDITIEIPDGCTRIDTIADQAALMAFAECKKKNIHIVEQDGVIGFHYDPV